MYNTKGSAEISMSYKFLEDALTHRGLQEGYLLPQEYFQINSLSLDDNNRLVRFDCEILTETIN